MLTKLAAMAINAKRVCAAVGKAGIEEIGLAELETLFGLFNAVKDGEQTIDEAFPIPIAKADIPATAAPTEAAKPAKKTAKKKEPEPSARQKRQVSSRTSKRN
jgi:hypothetical protein